MRFTKIILEGDAFSVITKIMHPKSSLSCVGNLVEDDKSLIKCFSWCKIQHVKREANEAAHVLAKIAFTIKDDL